MSQGGALVQLAADSGGGGGPAAFCTAIACSLRGSVVGVVDDDQFSWTAAVSASATHANAREHRRHLARCGGRVDRAGAGSCNSAAAPQRRILGHCNAR